MAGCGADAWLKMVGKICKSFVPPPSSPKTRTHLAIPRCEQQFSLSPKKCFLEASRKVNIQMKTNSRSGNFWALRKMRFAKRNNRFSQGPQKNMFCVFGIAAGRKQKKAVPGGFLGVPRGLLWEQKKTQKLHLHTLAQKSKTNTQEDQNHCRKTENRDFRFESLLFWEKPVAGIPRRGSPSNSGRSLASVGRVSGSPGRVVGECWGGPGMRRSWRSEEGKGSCKSLNRAQQSEDPRLDTGYIFC